MRDSIKAQFEMLDERFRSCGGDGWIERLHTGCRWTEGPAYFPAGRYLLFSDIPNDRILRWDETTSAVGVFRHLAGYANGHTVDRQVPRFVDYLSLAFWTATAISPTDIVLAALVIARAINVL